MILKYRYFPVRGENTGACDMNSQQGRLCRMGTLFQPKVARSVSRKYHKDHFSSEIYIPYNGYGPDANLFLKGDVLVLRYQ